MSATTLEFIAAPSAPNITATVTFPSTRLDLAWTDNSANETGFEIYKSLDGTTFSLLAATADNATAYTDAGLTPDTTYWYKLRAVSDVGRSDFTDFATGKTNLTWPTALTAVALTSNSVVLTWTDASTNETGFEIYRSPNGTAYTQLVKTDPDVTTHTDTNGLAAETTYWYRIRAVNDDGPSNYAGPVSVKTLKAVPAAPTAFYSPSSTPDSIDLAWKDNANNETAYELYRSLNGTTYTLLVTTAADTITHIDTGLAANTTYWYKLCAVGEAGRSAFAFYSTKTPEGISAPTDLMGTISGTEQITLSWRYTSPLAASYFEVEHSVDNVDFVKIGQTADGVTLSFIHDGVTDDDGPQHYYRVRTVILGRTPPTSPYSATLTLLQIAPSAPTALTATPISSGSIDLVWTDNSIGEQGFHIYRSFTGKEGTFFQIGTTRPDTTFFTDSRLYPSTTYWYEVRAFNAVDDSERSNMALATTFSGEWVELADSAKAGGVSKSSSKSSTPSVAVDKSGRVVVVWQETVLGIDQVRLAVFHPDENQWFGVITKCVVDDITWSGAYWSYNFGYRYLSNEGNGISLSSGDSEEPLIMYDAFRDAFFIVWQQYTNGPNDTINKWRIVARKMQIRHFLSNNDCYTADFDDVDTSTLMVYGTIDIGRASTIVSRDVSYQSIRPQAFLNAAETPSHLYVTWQEYLPTNDDPNEGNWDIYAARMDTTTQDPGNPSTFFVDRLDGGTGLVSNTATSSLYPTITGDGSGNLFVFWQEGFDNEPDGEIDNWEIYGKTLTGSAWVGAITGGADGDNVSNNTGYSQHPKAAMDPSGRPYVTWDDNSADFYNHDIYIKRRTLAGTGWEEVNDATSTITSASGGGISESVGASFFPSISIDSEGNVFVAWHDSTSQNWEILVREYSVGVPEEGPAWVSMDYSHLPPGISDTAGSSLLPTIRSQAGSVYVVWEEDTNGNIEIYLKRW